VIPNSVTKYTIPRKGSNMELSNSGNGQVIEYEEQKPIVMNPMDATPAQFRAGLDRRKENRDTLLAWIRSSLVEDRDYGSIMIRGVKSKPSLLKPGAEKIAGMLGLIPRFPNLKEYEASAISGQPIDLIILKCELQNQAGQIVGEGVGARSTEKQDNGDLNKALKMASKSAMIDATLRCAGISEIFTQDVEDMSISNPVPPRHDEIVTPQGIELATEKQVDAVGHLLENSKVTIEEKRNIHFLIEEGLHKSKAGEILNHFYGASRKERGSWVRISRGALADR
jgi:hypothetical protein